MTTATTGPTTAKGAVGTAHTRVEGRDKVTGAARYAGEIPFADLAHGWLVLSTVARAASAPSTPTPSSACPACSPSSTTATPRASTPTTWACWAFRRTRPPPSSRTTGCRTRMAGRPRRRRDARAGEGGRRGPRRHVRHGTARHHALRRPPRRLPGRRTHARGDREGDLAAGLAASAVVVDEEYTTPKSTTA